MLEYIEMQPLDALREGERACIVGVDEGHALGGRLVDLGWTAGTPIRCVRVSPLGDPVAFEVRGSVIALRRADRRGIWVRRPSGADG